MTLRRWLFGTTLITAALVTTACGGGAETPPPSTPTTSAAAPGEWAKVKVQPKTVDIGFRTKPCDSLTQAERTELKLPSPPVPKESPVGCTFANKSTNPAEKLEVEVVLSELTLVQKFGPTAPEPKSGLIVGSVSGFPAISSLLDKEQRVCMVFVAVSATETLHATHSASLTPGSPVPNKDACGYTRGLLEKVIAKLPAGT
ncbi:hypothetical protein JOF53_005632 [Crossiella equi]|uniref:DUF3558 domain-containing protein n=1 Tax=Crossiella equi TaxID=130796 RepID=A0ABS5AJL5_9PSEU|nr:DUF3558 family protein [Crossiella equi]MBP2476760.1 hypothetical protein [Crossiella equi]